MAAKKERRIAWFLRAPDCGLAVVAAPDYEQATVKAAEVWGVPWGKVVAKIEVERTVEQQPNVCVECGAVYNYSRDALCERCRNRKRREHEEMRKAAGAYRRREFYRKEKQA